MLPRIVAAALGQPSSRTHSGDEVQMVVQIRVHTAQAVQQGALLALRALPAPVQPVPQRAPPDPATGVSSSLPARAHALQRFDLAQYRQELRVVLELATPCRFEFCVSRELQLPEERCNAIHQCEQLPLRRDAIRAAQTAVGRHVFVEFPRGERSKFRPVRRLHLGGCGGQPYRSSTSMQRNGALTTRSRCWCSSPVGRNRPSPASNRMVCSSS